MPLDHYVSQVYLRNFYSPVLGDRMYAMRKSDLKSFTPNSKSVCRINDGSTNAYLKEDRAIEEFLRTIEPKYNPALERLIEGKIDVECIRTIAGFVAYVITCSPTGMRVFSEPLRAMVETMAVHADKGGLIPRPPKELGGESLAELLRSGDIKIEVDPKYPQAVGINSVMQHVAVFGNFKWDILLNPFNDNSFFTSDFPVAVEETADWRIVSRVVPLAPNLAIRIRPDLTIDRKRADLSFENFGYRMKHLRRREVVEINRLIVRCAEDTVFYRDDLAWIPRFIAKNRYYRVDQITNKLPAPGGSFVISTQRVVPISPSPAVVP